MAQAAYRLMDIDQFFEWASRQKARYELVDGIPLEMMSGASGLHDRIVTNLIIALGTQLRGGRCRPTTADIALRTRIRSVRRPDVTVTCDPPAGDVYEAREPRMVVEVLSPSNKGIGWERKMREYRRHPALEYILLVDSETVGVSLYQRDQKRDWDALDADMLADTIELPALGCKLTLAEIYEGTELPESPPEDQDEA